MPRRKRRAQSAATSYEPICVTCASFNSVRPSDPIAKLHLPVSPYQPTKMCDGGHRLQTAIERVWTQGGDANDCCCHNSNSSSNPPETEDNPEAITLAEPLRRQMMRIFCPQLSPMCEAEFLIDAGDASQKIL